MERKIGEILEFGGEWYQCIKGLGCNECDLSKITCYHRFESGSCSPNMRKDGTQVIFKKLEKVGEPYVAYGKVRQKYKLHAPLTITNGIIDKDISCDDVNGIVDIEIKQNNEDMEERELDSRMAKVIDEAIQKMGEEIGKQIEANINKQRMKPFNLEAAKAGKPVCTRDGRKARIICFDRNDLYPIVALIECEDGKEMIGAYSKEGCTEIYEIKGTDLMMLPEKKEGWINIYEDMVIYESKEEAELNASKVRELIATAKVKWEE